MPFTLATFNVRDLFDAEPPHVMGELDAAPGGYGPVERARAEQLYRDKLATLALVVQRLDADVVAFQEVKNASVLDALRAVLPSRDGVPCFGYGPALAAGADRRGIACGLLSRFPALAWREHAAGDLPFPGFVPGDPAPFATRLRTHRGVLEARLALPDATALTVVVVHFKSNLPTPLVRADGALVPFDSHHALAEGMARSAVSRIAEALFVRRLVDTRFDEDPGAQLAVVGDFNDVEGSVPVRAVAGDLVLDARGFADPASLGAFRARALYPCARAVAPDARFSVLFQNGAQQIDHVLASRALFARFRDARFLNETLREESTAADGGGFVLASDHAPLWTAFA